MVIHRATVHAKYRFPVLAVAIVNEDGGVIRAYGPREPVYRRLYKRSGRVGGRSDTNATPGHPLGGVVAHRRENHHKKLPFRSGITCCAQALSPFAHVVFAKLKI